MVFGSFRWLFGRCAGAAVDLVILVFSGNVPGF